VAAWTSRRTLRSSARRHQSSDDTTAAAATNEQDGGDVSSQSFPRAKWGAGWRSKQPSKPAGLSPEEQAQREALLASQVQQSRNTQSKENTRSDDTAAAAAGTNGQDGGADSRQSLPRSKWGSGWRREQPSKPAGLSPAEQAQREALLVGQSQQSGNTESKENTRSDHTAPAAANEQDGGATYRQSFPRAKWGSGWRNKQPSKPAGLSPAEQAQREALLGSQSQQSGNVQSKEHARSQDDRAKDGRNDKSGQGDGTEELLSIITKYSPRKPFHPPARRLQHGTIKVHQDIRYTDWKCPNCGYDCFGRHAMCPSCNTVRPEVLTRSKRPDPSEQSAKIKQLGQEVLSDWEEGKLTTPSSESPGPDKKESEPEGDMSNKGGVASDSIVSDVLPEKHADAPETLLERKEESKTDYSDSQSTQETEEWSDAIGKSIDGWDSRGRREIEVPEEDRRSSKSSKRGGFRTRESELEEDDFDEDELQRRAERRRLKKEKKKEKAAKKQALYLPEFISVSNLADVLGVRPAYFVARLEEMGFDGVTYGHVLDAETAGLIAQEFGFEPIFDTEGDDLRAAPEPEDKSVLHPRPPVVTIMGHVDHGKTTILDYLRKSSIAASEHGGITQHIGAFSVSMPSGKTITFLDTPGHEAFLDMRRRGANVTDIVVLVVAADDSVKPQTVEAIKHAKEANVPIIVAINKIDKDNVNPEKVKQDLARHGVDVEDYGGDVQAICVSGKTGQGMLDLEEAIVTLSEMLDHRADPDGNVEGWVIESSTKASGRVATVLVRRGTLRPGDIVVAGTTWARVRTLKNEFGATVDEATPGTPVEVDGWREQPAAGSEVLQAPSEQKAKDVVEYRLEKSETQKLSQDTAAINAARRETLEKRQQEASEEEESPSGEEAQSGPKPVNFLIKADVSGSVEALVNAVSAIGNNEVYANILRSGVGPITEFDIEHAATAKAHIISFNMPIEPSMSRKAELSHVKIMDHRIIYELIDDVKAKMSEHLPPSVSQRVTGEAEIGQIFHITVKGRKTTAIAGCRVRNGIISRTKKVRVLRGQEVIYDGNHPGSLFFRELAMDKIY